MTRPYLVGVTGGSGSGKTFFLQKLKEHFAEGDICLVTQDNYYREKSKQPIDEKGIENFDTPQSIDSEHFYRDLLALKRGTSVSLPEYTFNNPQIAPRQLTFHPAPIIVVEGIMIYYFEKIRDLFDLKIFIEASEIIKLKRRIRRDEKERGYDLEDVLYRYEHHVNPNYKRYIQPTRDRSDVIIVNNSGFDKALDMVIVYLKSRLQNQSL